MAAKVYPAHPEPGTIVAFSPNASKRLAGVPGKVRRVIARLNNGDYLLTLEYDKPVKVVDVLMTYIDALASQVMRIEPRVELALQRTA